MTYDEAIDLVDDISFCDWAHDHNLCTYATTGCSDCQISHAKIATLSALRDAAERENPKPLTCEEFINRNKPVYLPLLDGTGYWCLCQNGWIIPPSGMGFAAKDRPNWIFYDYPPKEAQG